MTHLKSFPTFTLIFLILCLSGVAHAHKINVFAYEEEGTIYSEATFSGGRPAKNSTVNVVAESLGDTLLLSGQTDETGTFAFHPTDRMKKEKLDLTIIVQSGDGHKNSWTLSASEYMGSTLSPEKTTNPDVSNKKRSVRPKEPGIKEILAGLAVIFAIALVITIFRSKKRGKHE